MKLADGHTVQGLAVLEWVARVFDGEDVGDFAQSFPIVQRAMELVAKERAHEAAGGVAVAVAVAVATQTPSVRYKRLQTIEGDTAVYDQQDTRFVADVYHRELRERERIADVIAAALNADATR